MGILFPYKDLLVKYLTALTKSALKLLVTVRIYVQELKKFLSITLLIFFLMIKLNSFDGREGRSE